MRLRLEPPFGSACARSHPVFMREPSTIADERAAMQPDVHRQGLFVPVFAITSHTAPSGGSISIKFIQHADMT